MSEEEAAPPTGAKTRVVEMSEGRAAEPPGALAAEMNEGKAAAAAPGAIAEMDERGQQQLQHVQEQQQR